MDKPAAAAAQQGNFKVQRTGLTFVSLPRICFFFFAFVALSMTTPIVVHLGLSAGNSTYMCTKIK